MIGVNISDTSNRLWLGLPTIPYFPRQYDYDYNILQPKKNLKGYSYNEKFITIILKWMIFSEKSICP